MPPVMIFDGECVLCSGAVRFVLSHEREPALHFATTQSNAGRALAAQYAIPTADLDVTFVLVEDGKALLRSDAALRIASYLRAPWRWLAILRFVPRPMRDAIYTSIARRRYRLFGKFETCMIPAATERHRFLLDPPPEA